MTYLERTLEVRESLLKKPEMLVQLSEIFESHRNSDGGAKHRPIGKGTSRLAYDAGALLLPDGRNLQLLLKLYKLKERREIAYAQEWFWGTTPELGAFEVYFDFLADRLSESPAHDTSVRFPLLNSNWGGTRVQKGDLGAVPYFQMVVKCGEECGWLTEGEPPLIEPMYSARSCGPDEESVHKGRIIDLSAKDSYLIELDRGGSFLAHENANNLGLHDRGIRYFESNHRIDL